MCSISGILTSSNFDYRKSELKDKSLAGAVERMNTALSHRGPDDYGVTYCEIRTAHCDVQLWLGSTRLAIIDTSLAGHQPMQDPERGNWITYNGETYNFRKLRHEIGGQFGPWRSSTDTEVVLRAYQKWGVDAFARLRGMFALAIWDAAKKELVLARDSFGIKPLYYSLGDSAFEEGGLDGGSTSQLTNSFVFASEVRALLASGLVPRNLNREGLSSYLEHGSVQAPLTIVDGVRSVMPGQVLRVSSGAGSRFRIQFSRFAASRNVQSEDGEIKSGAKRPNTRTEAVSLLRAKLEESVKMHLVSDVPLGVFLSGGMDSSALVALMSRVSEQKPKTFSVVFEEADFTEASHSRAVAEWFDTQHSEILLSEDQLLAMLPDAVKALDQPTMDGVNTFVVSKATKSAGVTVALSGLGGDELFAGYPSFIRALKLQTTSAVSKRVLRALSGVGKVALNGSVQRNKFWQLAASDCAPSDVYRVTRQLFSPDSIRLLVTRDLNGSVQFCHERNNGKQIVSTSDTVNTISRLELQGYMANTLLRDADTTSMAHSLEVRVPFVDVDVVDYTLALPGEWKVNTNNSGVAKPLLADALADLLPRNFLARPKMGFTLPFEKWMQSRLFAEVSSVFENENQLAASGLAAGAVGNLWRRFLRTPRAVGWSRPWALYVLNKWCEINGVSY
jgi:asparagine synthase (glutamine-hydrolysing)